MPLSRAVLKIRKRRARAAFWRAHADFIILAVLTVLVMPAVVALFAALGHCLANHFCD